MKLTDTQLVLLSAQGKDGAVELGSKLKGGAEVKAIDKLMREQLVEAIPATDGFPVWRRDDQKGALGLRNSTPLCPSWVSACSQTAEERRDMAERRTGLVW
jgi:hypothetical protein